MDLAPSAAQQLLAQSAKSLLAERCPPERVQALALDPRGFAQDLWKEMATLGWAGLLVPPELGGGGGSVLDVIVLVETMGRACLPSPYIPSAVVATRMLLGTGRCQGRAAELLSRMALGDRICCIAVMEESARLEPDAIAMSVEAPGRLTGVKLFVQDAHAATDVIVLGRGAGGLSAVLLPLERPGLVTRPLDSMTGDKLFALSFEGVETHAGDLLGSAGGGWALAEPALRLGALARSAEMVGAAQRILDLCLDHARVRVQGGRPIGAYQAVQHACADLFCNVESARWLVYEAAWKLERNLADAAVAVAAAKAYAGEACLGVARRGHQIMGAIGYCEEHPLHLFHKRILASAIGCGEAGLHLEMVAESIGLA